MEKEKKEFKNFFARHFSFEKDINLTDQVEVLFRRNIVIKNIIFFSNLIYSLILFIITLGNSTTTNWIFTVLLLPLTFMINRTIKQLIYSDKKELLRQQIAMYMCSFYMFLTAILLYLKLQTGNVYLSEAGYMLLYYSLIVVSLYQNRKMLKQVFIWMLIIISILHFTITYDIGSKEYSKDILTFIQNFFGTKESVDIFLRTIILIGFMVVVYIITIIGENMQEARNEELIKRQKIQDDFTDVVSNLFQVMLETRLGYNEDISQLPLLSLMSARLASLYGLAPAKCNEIKEFVNFHIDHHIDFKVNRQLDNEEMFEKLRQETHEGALIIKRIQLSQKCENIVRAHLEGVSSPEFKKKMNTIQYDIDSLIILICDIYITLRSVKNYKRPYSHSMAIMHLENEFSDYFNEELFLRFMKFDTDFDEMFKEYIE